MTAIEANVRFLLLAVLAEIELFAEVPDDAFDAGDPFVVAMCRDGVPFTPALWVGQPLPAARRMAFSRAARRLADRGLARRITEASRDRVRYLVLTPDGLSRALALAGNQADQTAVREGLARTRWGRTLLLEAKSHRNQSDVSAADAKTDLGRRGREPHPQADRNGRSAVNLFPRRR